MLNYSVAELRLFILNGCKKVEIKDNVLPHAFSIKDIRFENMKKKYRK